jgi:hypothetical protein
MTKGTEWLIAIQLVGEHTFHLLGLTIQTEGLLVNHSKMCKVPGHHGDDNIMKRLAEWYFLGRKPPKEKLKLTRWCMVYSMHNKIT